MKPVTPVLFIAVVLLAGLAAWQYQRIGQLQDEIQYAQRTLVEQAGKLATERLQARRGELVGTMQWLHEFYAAADGLARPEGLWLSEHKKPDFEALGAWVFDVYLTARVKGTSDADARQAVVDAIKGTDEWRRRHPK